MRVILLLAAITMAPSPAAAQGCPQEQRDANVIIGSVARDCVHEQALALEKSGESPSDIATAAMGQCRSKLDLMRGSCGGDALADELAKRLHERAIALIVSLRSNRAGGK